MAILILEDSSPLLIEIMEAAVGRSLGSNGTATVKGVINA